jgi:4-hydroxy-tetrahydrodipicolinate synthase
MKPKLSSRIYAAVLVPRNIQGVIEQSTLAKELEFLFNAGIRNFVFNGATGEYCMTNAADLEHCLQTAKKVLPLDATFLCGVGAASLRETLELGQLSLKAGAEGLLLPMPYFFPYAQDDLVEFVEQAASALSAPILLYNLPQFTSGLEPATVVKLVQKCENVIGIKDSSGSLEIFRTLTREGVPALRICGNDAILPQVLTEGIVDGAISGVACVIPELLLKLVTSKPGSEAFSTASNHLVDLVPYIDALPCPWGLKVLAEMRGISKAIYNLPVSPERAHQIVKLQNWFKQWTGSVTTPKPAHSKEIVSC